MDITEIQDELLRLEYPNLLPDHDPDIERYYYLRSIGQSRDALGLYQNRLRIRYPDDNFRTWLLRSYRSHDPAFRSLLAKGYRLLGARSLERVKQILFIIAERADSYNEKDVYSTIKTAEDILQFLPKERYEAIAGMERFLRYSSALELNVKSIAKATELVRAYLTDSLSVVEEERRKRSENLKRASEAERERLVRADWDSYYYQKKYGVHVPMIDLSAVIFSPDDLARIEIPPFTRIEDQILGYCIKYWNSVNDPAFERILFLYSRKYGTKNYDVYMAIRRGRQAKNRDDEILASIMSVLVTGYYYSIQGDIYLQRNWNAIKYSLANQKVLPAPAAPQEPRQIEAVPEKADRAAKKTKKSARPRIAPRPKSRTAPRIAPKPLKPVRPRAVAAKPANTASTLPARTGPVKVPYKLKPAPEAKTTIVARPQRPVAPAQARAASPVQSRPAVPVRPMVQPAAPVQTRPAAARPPVQPAARPPAQPRPAAAARPAMQPRPAAVPVRPVQSRPQPALRAEAPLKPAVSKTAQAGPRAKAPESGGFPAKPLASASPPRQGGYRPAPFVTSSPPPARPKQRVFTSKTLEKAKGSVSDRLRELSGRSYDVYENRFLAKTRNAIRKVLGTGRGIFFNLPEEAEDMVYNFLRDHYSDPYMDWEDSPERKNLLALGFDLPSLYPVIDECYRTL